MKRYKINITIVAAVIMPALFFSSCSKNTPAAPAPTPVTTTGVVTTVAGNGTPGFANGTGTSASFFYPQGVAVDATTGILYVADQGNNQIRKISTAGAVTTLAGTLIAGSTNASAIGVAALFNGPTGVAADGLGNLYVADYGNNNVRKIVLATGVISTLAGGSKTGNTNATGTSALFNGPAGVAVDALGNVYVADFNNHSIREISPLGVVTTLAGTGKAGNVNATGTAASFNGPRSVAVDAAGNVYVADANNNLIREISPLGVVTTLAGTGAAGNADGAAAAATFRYPSGVAVDASGNVYVADANNNLIRKISGGTVTSIAGSGYLSLTTPFNAPVGVAVDATGTVYVANDLSGLIQKVK